VGTSSVPRRSRLGVRKEGKNRLTEGGLVMEGGGAHKQLAEKVRPDEKQMDYKTELKEWGANLSSNETRKEKSRRKKNIAWCLVGGWWGRGDVR